MNDLTTLGTLDLTSPKTYRVDTSEPAAKEAKRLFDFIAKEMEGRASSLLDFPQYSYLVVTELQAKLLMKQQTWNGSWLVDYGLNPLTHNSHDWMVHTPSGAVEVRLGTVLL